MLGWLLIAVALVVLVYDPGLRGLLAVAAAVLVYLVVRWRSGALAPREQAGEDADDADPREEGRP